MQGLALQPSQLRGWPKSPVANLRDLNLADAPAYILCDGERYEYSHTSTNQPSGAPVYKYECKNHADIWLIGQAPRTI